MRRSAARACSSSPIGRRAAAREALCSKIEPIPLAPGNQVILQPLTSCAQFPNLKPIRVMYMLRKSFYWNESATPLVDPLSGWLRALVVG